MREGRIEGKGFNGRASEKSEMWLIMMRDWRWSSGIGGNRGGRGLIGIQKLSHVTTW